MVLNIKSQVILVSHKYGTDMAAVTDSALSTAGQIFSLDKNISGVQYFLLIYAGNSYLTFYNAAALGPKGIAKRAAKDTGKAFIGVDTEAVAARANTVPDQQNLVRTRFFCPHPYPSQTRLKRTHIFRQSEMFWTRRAVIHRGQSTKGEAGKASNIQMSSDDFSGWAMILKSLNDAGYIF